MSSRGVGVVALAAVAGFGHLLYPAWLAFRAARKGPAPGPKPTAWPDVTAVVAAYRESAVIGAKVDDLLANGYPGELRILVAADDRKTAEAARATPATVLEASERLGKAGALNRALAVVETPFVVFTDANTRLQPGSIESLVRWFSEPSVGAVAGEKRVEGADGEGFYWRFESWLKERETRTGGTVGLVGELAAMRVADFTPIPEDVIVDDLWLALDVIEAGKRVVYEPTAVSFEEASPSRAGEWERRTRIVAGTLDVLWRRRASLVAAPGDFAPKLWGHRLVRSSFGPLAHLCLLGLAARRSRTSPLAAGFVALHLAGAASFLRGRTGDSPARSEALLRQVLFLQAVALGGMVRWLTHERPSRWPKPDRPEQNRLAATPS